MLFEFDIIDAILLWKFNENELILSVVRRYDSSVLNI